MKKTLLIFIWFFFFSTIAQSAYLPNKEFLIEVAKGNVPGHSVINKFGSAPDFDIADGFVTVWDGAEDGEGYEQMIYSYSLTDDIDSLTAEDDTDTQTVEIQGLDVDYNLSVESYTLTGNTPVVLDPELLRVFRIKNTGSTNIGASDHVFVYVSGGTVTGGVPQVGADVRGVIHGSNNQTEMAVYTIPNNKTGYMLSWYVSTAGAKRDSSHTVKVFTREEGGVFQLKHKANIDVNGTSELKFNYEVPLVFSEKTDIEVQVDTDKDEAGISAGFAILLVDDGY